MKHCPGCGEIKPPGEFNKDKSTKSGFTVRCKACKKSYDASRYSKEPEPFKLRSRVQRVEKRTELNAYKYSYRRRNPEYYAKKSVEYYAKRLQATPTWITEAQKAEIKELCAQARQLSKELGVKYCVDHIIPLQGDNVSGLHVPWNLRVITLSHNSEKSNKVSNAAVPRAA